MEQTLPQLSKATLSDIKNNNKPNEKIFDLQEKVLQFGTGVLLRGLPDFYIDKADKQGIFNGRIVIVKSTAQNSADEFALQDNLYTHCLRGFYKGNIYTETVINASISRVLNAAAEWEKVLDCAGDINIKLIISNTTEAGIVLDKNDKINSSEAPHSFPGKLLAVLYKRYRKFEGSKESGMVIIATELIPENAQTLLRICLQLAELNNLENEFCIWLKEENDFCNSLVDRIVPGKPNEEDRNEILTKSGYEDNLLIVSEPYGLWAIQSSRETTKALLSFQQVTDDIVITPDISKYRDLKLYLLNATHTFGCVTALASGFATVKEAMDNNDFENFLKGILFDESSKAVTDDRISEKEAEDFSAGVLDRFRNPFIKHLWTDIMKNVILKMKMRCIPLILLYYKKFNSAPTLMLQGFATFIKVTEALKNNNGKYAASFNNQTIAIEDGAAGKLYDYWQTEDKNSALKKILSDKDLWGTDLTQLQGFEESIGHLLFEK